MRALLRNRLRKRFSVHARGKKIEPFFATAPHKNPPRIRPVKLANLTVQTEQNILTNNLKWIYLRTIDSGTSEFCVSKSKF